MQLLLVGISHRTAPVELRERLDFQARGVADALRALALRGSAREAVVVSTCNRAELYVACDEAAATRQDLMRFVSEFNGVPAGDIAPHVYDVTDMEVARHLFQNPAHFPPIGNSKSVIPVKVATRPDQTCHGMKPYSALQSF